MYSKVCYSKRISFWWRSIEIPSSALVQLSWIMKLCKKYGQIKDNWHSHERIIDCYQKNCSSPTLKFADFKYKMFYQFRCGIQVLVRYSNVFSKILTIIGSLFIRLISKGHSSSSEIDSGCIIVSFAGNKISNVFVRTKRKFGWVSSNKEKKTSSVRKSHSGVLKLIHFVWNH